MLLKMFELSIGVAALAEEIFPEDFLGLAVMVRERHLRK
tara:strand:+ start:200 stop:316 length:117 start_codon:yes stop_codon:yes gene_type:complete